MENERENLNAEQQRRFQIVKRLRERPTEEYLWEAVIACQEMKFVTYSGLSFRYELHRGKNWEYNRELWIDRREKSKSLAWSSVMLAFQKVKDGKVVVDRPKALGDIRGVTYIYAIFYRLGLIDVPEQVKEKMTGTTETGA